MRAGTMRAGRCLTRTLLALCVHAAATACTPPGRAPEPRPVVRAVVISDINESYGSTSYSPVVHQIVARITGDWLPDLVLAAGDLVAGQSPQLPDSVVRAMWLAFDAAVAAPLRDAGIPLVATPGNHDASAYPAHARDRRIAAEYWRGGRRTVAVPLDDDHYPFRYTVRAGPVFMVVWDATTQESARDAELVEWLRESLDSPAARASRHRVVLTHLPLFAVAQGRDRPGELLADGDELRSQLEGWGATLVISGHHHAYFPGRSGQLELLHAGALGGGPRPLLGDGEPPRRTVTLLDFFADSLGLTTHVIAGDGGLSPLADHDLPPVICSRGGRVARRDVAGAAGSCPRAPAPD